MFSYPQQQRCSLGMINLSIYLFFPAPEVLPKQTKKLAI